MASKYQDQDPVIRDASALPTSVPYIYPHLDVRARVWRDREQARGHTSANTQQCKTKSDEAVPTRAASPCFGGPKHRCRTHYATVALPNTTDPKLEAFSDTPVRTPFRHPASPGTQAHKKLPKAAYLPYNLHIKSPPPWVHARNFHRSRDSAHGLQRPVCEDHSAMEQRPPRPTDANPAAFPQPTDGKLALAVARRTPAPYCPHTHRI